MRLIDADAIWYDQLLMIGNKEHPLEWAVSRPRINAMPTIEAEPKHGRWLTKEYMYGDPNVGTEDMWIDRSAEQSDYYAYCSICGKATGYDGEGNLILSDYCPNCGASMLDEVELDGEND